MRASRPTVAASFASFSVAAATLTAGCGASAKPVDVTALKSQLGGVADLIDKCVATTNDTRKCASTQAIGALPGGAELGKGLGQIQIDASRALSYQLTAAVTKTVRFSIVAEPVGARSRKCTPAGTGACPKTGSW